MRTSYDIVWRPAQRRYGVSHVNNRSGGELRWYEREGYDFNSSRAARDMPSERRPVVIMGTVEGYAAASASISEYPSQGAYV